MKRCPQCEFIYEDDQSLCDMDGVLLVLDSRSLPSHHALAPLSSPPTKTQKRNRAVPAFATVILALVLGMVYYVSTQRTATPEASGAVSTASTTSTLAPTTNPTPETQTDQVPAASETESTEKEEAKPEITKPSTVTPAKKTAAKATATSQTKSSTEKKDESKVGSILKKTGRILKKPFKL